jgi:hypothetical protein
MDIKHKYHRCICNLYTLRCFNKSFQHQPSLRPPSHPRTEAASSSSLYVLPADCLEFMTTGADRIDAPCNLFSLLRSIVQRTGLSGGGIPTLHSYLQLLTQPLGCNASPPVRRLSSRTRSKHVLSVSLLMNWKAFGRKGYETGSCPERPNKATKSCSQNSWFRPAC